MQKNTFLNIKFMLAVSYDLVATVIAWFIAYQLRFNFEIPPEHWAVMSICFIGVIFIQLACFLFFGLYRGVWRFASLVDLKKIILSVITASILLSLAFFMLRFTLVVPRSVLIINPALLILIMGGGRFAYRAIKDYQQYSSSVSKGDPIVIVGSGQTAISLAKELLQSSDWRLVGFLSEDASLNGREISGIKVLGTIGNLAKAQLKFGFKKLILAQPLLSYQERRAILSQANQLNIQAFTVPTIDDLMTGRLNISQIRPVDIEDLLGRDEVSLDSKGLIDLIKGEVILVTGAGGSIGSELCRQIIKFKPRHLVCFDISEYALYQLEQAFLEAGQSASNIYVVGDVKNEARLNRLFQFYKPKVVFHAAAYKHVPLMENQNVSEALHNNVLGTYTVASVAKKYGVNKFILVSTDKAINPTNVMGASKRLAEMVCQGLQSETGTHFVMVRFGNVLDSSGSVIPKFRKQIAAGGPVTVTHPKITRYFMSISESAQLVIQAGLIGNGGEVFVLDMGEPIRILDLARDMIKLSGFNEKDIQIQFTGLRPGEKLYEELLADEENTLMTTHQKLRIASVTPVKSTWIKGLQKWILSSVDQDEDALKEALKSWAKDYQGDVNAQ